jgi:hypothetical protein
MPIVPANAPTEGREVIKTEDEQSSGYERPSKSWPFPAPLNLPEGERVINSERRE